MSEPRNTRERIQYAAMELFNEYGYDRTSLREIAEAIGLTKAALYYHFKTKDEIAASFFDDFLNEVEALRIWAEAEPSSMETRREILRRYSFILLAHGQTLRFMHHNQPALRHLSRSDDFKEEMHRLRGLLMPENPDTIKRLRAVDAIMTMHIAWFLDLEEHTPPAELRQPALDIAIELIETNGK